MEYVYARPARVLILGVFHTPTAIKFVVFGKFSGVYYAKKPTNGSPGFITTNMFDTIASNRKQPKSVSFPKGWLEFNVPFQHKYGGLV